MTIGDDSADQKLLWDGEAEQPKGKYPFPSCGEGRHIFVKGECIFCPIDEGEEAGLESPMELDRKMEAWKKELRSRFK